MVPLRIICSVERRPSFFKTFKVLGFLKQIFLFLLFPGQVLYKPQSTNKQTLQRCEPLSVRAFEAYASPLFISQYPCISSIHTES